MPVIRLRNISVSFGGPAILQDIDLSIDAGERVCLLGRNGAGKSTTIKMLTGILVPSSGEVKVGEWVPWRERTAYVRHIGVVFGQRTTLWWDLPVIESFDLLRHIYRIPADRYRQNLQRFREMLDQLREKYDRIVFDAPPVGAVTDPVILASLSRGAL